MTDDVFGRPWAMLPAPFAALAAAVQRGERPADPAAIGTHLDAVARDRLAAAGVGATARKVGGMIATQVGRVAVLPLAGMIVQRPNMWTAYGLATSAEQFAAAHAELVADDSVGSIIWDADSPGGSVAGVPEAADRLASLRGKKRTVAVSNSLMASAAYWLASAADEVVAAPSSLTGSIGVVTAHEDHSRANSQAGVAVTYVFAGKHKVDGNADAPLSPDALASMQEMVNDYYGQFVRAVAANRRTSQAAVRSGYGEGGVLTATRATAAGLADRVGTLADVVAWLAGKGNSARPATARGYGSSTAPAAREPSGWSLDLAAARQRQAEAH